MNGLKHIGGMAALIFAVLPALLFSHVVQQPDVVEYITTHQPWLADNLSIVHVSLVLVLLLSGLAVNWMLMTRADDDTLDALGVAVVATASTIIAIPAVGMIGGWIYLAFRSTVAAGS